MEQQTNSNTHEPTLCRSECKNYGSSSMDGMCPKCYEDKLKSSISSVANISSPSPASMASSTNSSFLDLSTLPIGIAEDGGVACPFSSSVPTHLPAHLPHPSRSSNLPHIATTSGSSASLSSDFALSNSPCSSSSMGVFADPICAKCKKIVGLSGFKCLCGGLFCFVDLPSDVHSCSYEWKPMGGLENNPADLLRMSLSRRDLMNYMYFNSFSHLILDCFVKVDVQEYAEERSEPIYEIGQILEVKKLDQAYYVADVLDTGGQRCFFPTKWSLIVRLTKGKRVARLCDICRSRSSHEEISSFVLASYGINSGIPQEKVDNKMHGLHIYYSHMRFFTISSELVLEMLANRKESSISSSPLQRFTLSALKESLPTLKKIEVEAGRFRDAAALQEDMEDLDSYRPENDPLNMSRIKYEIEQCLAHGNTEEIKIAEQYVPRKRPLDEDC